MPPTYDPNTIRLPPPPARVHFVGIGGVGVSGLARMLKARGYRVSGSDAAASPTTDELVREGVAVAIGHDAAHVAQADYVVVTAAARDDNPELVAARRHGVPVVKRAALLGALALDGRSLAVAGTHGKSTTSGMAALALDRAGLEPSFAVGATVRELGANARLGRGGLFVVEADEYDFSFLWLRPTVAIVTTIEYDHPDMFVDLEAVLDAFERFVAGILTSGALVISADDPGCRRLLMRLGGHTRPRIVTFGERHGDWRITAAAGRSGIVRGPGGQVFALRLAVPGRHNLRNALSVLAAADSLGIDPQRLVAGLLAFGGVGRRFEVLLDSPLLTVVSDYAHHPTEIAVTIEAARERYPDRRLLVVFQPHTYSRTKALLTEFAAALDAADSVILAEIYPSRETDSLGVSSADIADRMTTPVALAVTPDAAVDLARANLREEDVVLVMGAGDIFRTAELLAAIESRPGETPS